MKQTINFPFVRETSIRETRTSTVASRRIHHGACYQLVIPNATLFLANMHKIIEKKKKKKKEIIPYTLYTYHTYTYTRIFITFLPTLYKSLRQRTNLRFFHCSCRVDRSRRFVQSERNSSSFGEQTYLLLVEEKKKRDATYQSNDGRAETKIDFPHVSRY